MENNILKEVSIKKDVKTSSDIIEEQRLVFTKDKNVIIDKENKEYKIKPYSLSLFTGTMMPVSYGCMVEGIFIDVEDLKK